MPLDDPRYVPLMGAVIDAMSDAEVPFCYWNYARHQPADEAWYPPSDADRLGVASSDSDQSRANLLMAKAAQGPFVWSG